jgi:glycosyltransferase involved in cell wall biosynthesis
MAAPRIDRFRKMTKPRLRVLHGITHLGLGGAEQVTLTLIRALVDRFDFAVFAARGIEESAVGRAFRYELESRRVPLHTGTRLPIKLGGVVLAGARLGRAIERFRPEAVHLHTEIPEAAYASMTALRRNNVSGPWIRTIHNAVYWASWPRLGRWCERRLGAGRVAAVSEDARAAFEAFRARSGAGPLPNAPVVVPNGVAVSAAARLAGPRPPHLVRILYGGRFEFQKGTDLLPKILSAVALPAGVSAELVLYGSGSHAARLHQLAASPPPRWKVRVEEPVADLTARMANCDLVIVPSRFEGVGLVAVEAALVGKPVVATAAPGLREALPPDHPWRAHPGDAAEFAVQLQRALAEAARWPEVTAKARAFVQAKFSVGAMADAYARLYTASATA